MLNYVKLNWFEWHSDRLKGSGVILKQENEKNPFSANDKAIFKVVAKANVA